MSVKSVSFDHIEPSLMTMLSVIKLTHRNYLSHYVACIEIVCIDIQLTCPNLRTASYNAHVANSTFLSYKSCRVPQNR